MDRQPRCSCIISLKVPGSHTLNPWPLSIFDCLSTLHFVNNGKFSALLGPSLLFP